MGNKPREDRPVWAPNLFDNADTVIRDVADDIAHPDYNSNCAQDGDGKEQYCHKDRYCVKPCNEISHCVFHLRVRVSPMLDDNRQRRSGGC